MADPANLLTQWARLLIGSLARAGLRRAIISPGSRSTPLAAALLDNPAFETSCVIDERSAAFVALGHAKLSGEPALLVCTSGSAPAHYFPAVIEADESRTPLVVLSADRPAHLQFNRSPQTIDQAQLFGRKVRCFMDLGEPTANIESLRALARKAAQAVAVARFPDPGPVHLNFPAAKPLEPVKTESPPERRLEDAVSELLADPAVSPAEGTLVPSASSLTRIVELSANARRPLIVAGPRAPHDIAAPKSIAELAGSSGWPLYAEPASQLRTQDLAATSCEVFDALCRTPRAQEYCPDFVLHFGQPATSGAWAEMLTQSPHLPRVVVCDHTWADPHNAATLMLRASQHETAAGLLGRLPPADASWCAQLAQANQVALDSTQRWLQARAASEPAPEGCHVRMVLDDLQPGDLLIVGNSLPIRLLDTVCTRLPARVQVLSQRGANGIDGLLSLAIGAARARPSGRAVLVLGDVSALHDVGGLYALSTQRPELSCVILNNGGGRIFEQLPIAGHARMDAWTTPHDVTLHQLANSFHVPGVRVDTARDLCAALALGRRDGGPIWIEALCQPDGAQQMYTELTREITSALAPSS